MSAPMHWGTTASLTCEECGREWEVAVVTRRVRRFCPSCLAARERERNRATSRDARYRRAYGIGADEVDAMISDQGGRCAVCHETPRAPLVVDHCHRSGRVRAMLCGRCNTLLGFMESMGRETLTRAAEYLAHHGSTF